MAGPEATPEQNGTLKPVITGFFGSHIAGTLAGFVPYPVWVGVAGEATALASDLLLKATPPAFVRIPDRVLAKDPGACEVTLTLDVKEAERKNLYGLTYMQTPDQDRPVNLGIDNRDWGALVKPGEMDVFHLHTDVRVSVSHPGIHATGNPELNFRGVPVCEDEIALNDHACFAATLREGIHSFDWQARSMMNPLLDVVFPSASLAFMIYSEVKSTYAIRKINQDGAVLEEIIKNPGAARYIDPHVADDIRLDLVQKWLKLAERPAFKQALLKFLKELPKETALDLSKDKLADMLGLEIPVGRNRFTQRVTVPDTHTPVISATVPHVTLEATDFGGTRLARVYDELTGSLNYSDACNSALRLSHDAPNVLPIGSGTINWTVTDVPEGINPADYYAPGYAPSASVQMAYTVADTQPPILVAPPGKVIVAPGPTVNPAGINLGKPKVIDLADPAPRVTNDAPPTFNVDSRVAVNWTATDSSGNAVSKVQWITAKTPNTNTPPTVPVSNISAATRTAETIEIRLDGLDVDRLPTSRGGSIVDPLSFEITTYPANGEFVAPLRPFFIEDFRLTPVGETEREGVRTSPLGANAAEFAALPDAQSRAAFLAQRYCSSGNTIPVNFPYEPTYVHVADSGNYYMRDSFWECTGLLGRGTPVERERISKWDADGRLLAQFQLFQLEGPFGIPLIRQADIFTVDKDENVWWQVYGALGNVLGLHRLNRNLVDLQRLIFVPLVAGDGRAWTNAHSDPKNGLVFVNDNRGIAVFAAANLTASGSLADFLNLSLGIAPIGRLTVDGNPLFFADQDCGLDNDRKFWMTTDSKSNLYVAEACSNRIHKFSPSVRRPDGSFAAGRYIGWMGSCSGNVPPWSGCNEATQTSRGYACDDLKCLRAANTAGTKTGQFNWPIHIALDPRDTLYVADFNNRRVQRFGDDGSFAGQAVSEGSGINQGDDPGFVLGNIGSPRAVAVNSSTLFVMQSAGFDYFLHSFKTLPFDPIPASGGGPDADGDGYEDNSVLIRYVPRFNFPGSTGQETGQDQLRYRVNDGLARSAEATVTITVTRNFRAPEDLAIRCYRPAAPATRVGCSLNEDTGLLVEFVAKDPDGIVGFDGLDTLAYTAVKPAHGTLTLQNSNAASATYLYTPDKDFNGAETIAYSVNDGTTFNENGGIVEVRGEFGLDILPVPDAPVLTIDEPAVAGRGFPTTITASYTDVDNNPEELPPRLRVDWGDGAVEEQGEIVEDANGEMVPSGPLLTSTTPAQGFIQGSHVFNANGVRTVRVCLLPTDLPGQVCKDQTLQVTDAAKVALKASALNVDTPLQTFWIPFEVEAANLVPESWSGIKARNAELVIDMSPNLLPVSVPPECQLTMSVRQYRCKLGDLAPGATVKRTIGVRINPAIPPRPKVTLDASVTHESPDVSAEISASSVVLVKWPDTDADKLPDGWELHHFGGLAASTGDSDTDRDGLSDVEEYFAGTDPKQSDSDHDGVPDFDEVKVYLTDPNSGDTDADGLPDQWEVLAGVDPNSAGDAQLDPDGDGLTTLEEYRAGTNPRNADTDNDRLPDGWETAHGLDPLRDDSWRDADGDGRSNLAEYLEGGDPQRDDIPPKLSIPANITVNATGALTAVPLGAATAHDVKDGPLAPIALNPGPFAPGAHTVTWRATDAAGNSTQATQQVSVVPMVSFAVDQTVAEGNTIQAVVELNGPALTYPVTVPYVVSGSALLFSDHNAASGTIQIDSGISASVAINIVKDNVAEPDETLVLTMGTPTNAVPGVHRSHTVNIVERNLAPVVTITTEQRGGPRTTIAADAGEVTITARVQDDSANSHAFNWTASDTAVMNSTDYRDASYRINPGALSAGLYSLRVSVTDNGVPIASTDAQSFLKVIASSPPLSNGADTDGDGVSDADEGSTDRDGDRIPDYLDDLPNTNMLRMFNDGRVLETHSGLLLRLGPTAFAGGGAYCTVAEAALAEQPDYGYPDGVVDFEMYGFAPGTSSQVVVPLKRPIPANSVYRKYVNGGWRNFIVDVANTLSSAPGQGGACPPPGSSLFKPGLTVGHGCIQLTIQDGGPNDADNQANGSIQDPGGLAVPVGVSLKVLNTKDQTASAGSATVVMRLRLSSESGDVELSSLTLQARGSGNDTDIQAVQVVVDSNANGVVDGGEEIIATGKFNQDNGTLQLNMFEAYAVPAGNTDLLVVVNL